MQTSTVQPSIIPLLRGEDIATRAAGLALIMIMATLILRGRSSVSRRKQSISIRHSIHSTVSSTRASSSFSSESGLSRNGNLSGTLCATILPKERLNYKHFKPVHALSPKPEAFVEKVKRRAEPSLLKQKSRQNNQDSRALNFVGYEAINPPEDASSWDENHPQWCLVLDLKFEADMIVSSGTKGEEHRRKSHHEDVQVSLHAQREVTETAIRCLQRLEMSTRRKIAYNRGHRKKIGSRVDSASSDASESLSASALSFWVQEEGDENTTSDDDDLDGKRKYEFSKTISNLEFWRSLMNYEETRLSFDLRNEGIPEPLQIDVKACPPTILSVNTFEDFATDTFVGIPLVVETVVLHADRAKITWFSGDEEVASDSALYVPTKDDVGKQITVVIAPVRSDKISGYEEVYHFAKRVQACPRLPILDLRDSWVRQKLDGGDGALRVLSYNLLADLYTSREEDQEAMYNHCQKEFLQRTRRMPLLVHEILAYRPDIVCLQEVDPSVFDGLLRPVMAANGYHGYYSNKASTQLEGCAMFWSLRRFEETAEMQEFAVRDLFVPDQDVDNRWASMQGIHKFLDKNPGLKEIIRCRVGQVLQVATLRPRSGQLGTPKRLTVGNTHLFYHPMADHIRLMQAYVSCRKLDQIRRECPGDPSPIIFCGDLNSYPLSGTLRLLLHREVDNGHYETWKNLNEYSWEKGEHEFLMEHGFVGNDADMAIDPLYVDESFEDASEEALEPRVVHDGDAPPTIYLPSCFPNLISGYQKIPEFTNYAVDFSETLDYILISEPMLEVVDAAPVFTRSDMEQFVAMPNEFMPSDHVSMLCDIQSRPS